MLNSAIIKYNWQLLLLFYVYNLSVFFTTLQPTYPAHIKGFWMIYKTVVNALLTIYNTMSYYMWIELLWCTCIHFVHFAFKKDFDTKELKTGKKRIIKWPNGL